MYKIIFIIIALSMLLKIQLFGCEISEKLSNLPELAYKEIPSPRSYKKSFELSIKQPINHFDSTDGFFYQKLFLSHIDFSKPVIFVFDGYDAKWNRLFELSKFLKGNQIYVEHRCFGKSMPDSLIYRHLTMEQVTADLHHIKQVFGELYKSKWIGTGISKGGQTALYYQYFYPDDIDVTVSYVPPLTLGKEDFRIYEFLKTVGNEDCRNKIENFQRLLLNKRKSLIPLLKQYYNNKNISFTYLDFEEAYEYSVMEFDFYYWQWGGRCGAIPNGESSNKKIFKYFISIDPMTMFSDNHMNRYFSHYYQAATELGYYGYETKKFSNLLELLPKDRNPMATFLPKGMQASFNSSISNKVFNWANNEGEKIVYIYGENDTWSACAVNPSQNLESLSFMIAGKHHGNARISSMKKKDRQMLVSKLEDWLNIEIKENYISNLFLKLYN